MLRPKWKRKKKRLPMITTRIISSMTIINKRIKFLTIKKVNKIIKTKSKKKSSRIRLKKRKLRLKKNLKKRLSLTEASPTANKKSLQRRRIRNYS